MAPVKQLALILLLASAAWGGSLRDTLDELPFDLNGFLDTRAGARTQSDPNPSETASLGEARLQLDVGYELDWARFRYRTDLVQDWVVNEWGLDTRELNVVLPFDAVDVKLGRQILTWGTGDLLFINDLFPKDWQSFFIGRDDEYLKAPSDAVKVSLFSDLANVDIVYTPKFDPDTAVDGDRLSYWNPLLGRRAGEDDRFRADEPDEWFGDDEIALRLHRTVGGYELALYGYRGYWKTPEGVDPVTLRGTYPKLSVYGASVRGNAGLGIGNVECGYYDSRDADGGDDPFVRNSEFRLLLGYEQELGAVGGKDFTVGLQYYLEWMMDHGAYERSLPPGMEGRDEDRHTVTVRLTKLLMNQNLTLSLFSYVSPSDGDAYLRPKAHYKMGDHWAFELGGNVFVGEDDHTFFGQFERNSNVYGAARYRF